MKAQIQTLSLLGRGGAQELREEPSPGPVPDSKQKLYSGGPRVVEALQMAKVIRTVPSSGETMQVGTLGEAES